MAKNRGVIFEGPGKVEIHNIDYPTFKDPHGKPIEHGVILKVVSTNICGSDQHMVRGRTTAPAGLILGHEITGEVIEVGAEVDDFAVDDKVLVHLAGNLNPVGPASCHEGFPFHGPAEGFRHGGVEVGDEALNPLLEMVL